MNTPQTYRGQQIGLPESGPKSLATTGPRLGAFVVDVIVASLVAALFVQRLPGSWSLIPLAIDYIGGGLAAGRTLGMYLFGLRRVRVDRVVPVDPIRLTIRTALLFLLVPALIFDRDGRGLHDRLTDTAVVRA